MSLKHRLRKSLLQVSFVLFLMGLFIVLGSWILSELFLNESQLADLASWIIFPSIIAVIFGGLFGFGQGKLWAQSIKSVPKITVMTDSTPKEKYAIPTSYKEFVLILSVAFACYLLANLIITKDIVFAVISSVRPLIPFGIGHCAYWGLVSIRLFLA